MFISGAYRKIFLILIFDLFSSTFNASKATNPYAVFGIIIAISIIPLLLISLTIAFICCRGEKPKDQIPSLEILSSLVKENIVRL